jgi:hypothetical protein
MAPKPIAPTETPQPSQDAAWAEAHKKLKDWTTRFHAAIGNRDAYAKAHVGFLREFERLYEEVRGSNKRSIVPYVEPIFNHSASQGYQPGVHYIPLLTGLTAFCQMKPPPSWTAPPDQFDKSPTPTLPPIASTSVPNPSPPTIIPPAPAPDANAKKRTTPSNAKRPGARGKPIPTPAPALAGKPAPTPAGKLAPTPAPAPAPAPAVKPPAKQKAPKAASKEKFKSKEFVQESSEEYHESDAGDAVRVNKPKSRNEAIDPKADPQPTKCTTCEKGGMLCLINPATVGDQSPACWECSYGKRKCSLCTKRTGGARKRKPVQVVPGEVGELACKWAF